MSRGVLHRTFLLLNVGLAVCIGILVLREVRQTPAIAPTAAPAPTKQFVQAAPAAPHYPDSAAAADQRRWLVDQLRAMGVPNQVLARIVMKDLDRRWNKYATQVSLQCRGNPEVLGALNLDIEAKRDGEMRAALGEEGFMQWDTDNMRREFNRGKVELSPAESGVAYALWKKLQQRDLALRQLKFKGDIDEADAGDAYAKDLAAYQQEMKTLLGDARYAQSQDVSATATAASLRQELASANPSESQFQELLQTEQQWNELRARLAKQPHDDGQYEQSLKDLDEARDEEYRRVLGADAFDALQKQEDPSYTAMKKYENLWGLDDTKIDYVYGALKYYQKSIDDYQASAREVEQSGQTVDWDAVKKNLQQFAQQTQQSLQNYLGPDGLDKLQRNGVVRLNQTAVDLPNSPGGRPY